MINDDKPYIELKLNNETYRTTLAYNGIDADTLIEKFKCLLVCAGFPPSVLNIDDEEGDDA